MEDWEPACFTTIKAMRRMWRAEVRENERLNKQLKLFGERAPNSSLDLISARLALKFRLGTAGLRQEEMESSKPRNWTRVRPMAANVFDTCVGHWMDASSEVSFSSSQVSGTAFARLVPKQRGGAFLDPDSAAINAASWNSSRQNSFCIGEPNLVPISARQERWQDSKPFRVS